jgi:hypothetical protein
MRLGDLVIYKGSERQRSANDSSYSEQRQQADPLPTF